MQDFSLRGGVDCRVSDGRLTHASLVTMIIKMTDLEEGYHPERTNCLVKSTNNIRQTIQSS